MTDRNMFFAASCVWFFAAALQLFLFGDPMWLLIDLLGGTSMLLVGLNWKDTVE